MSDKLLSFDTIAGPVPVRVFAEDFTTLGSALELTQTVRAYAAAIIDRPKPLATARLSEIIGTLSQAQSYAKESYALIPGLRMEVEEVEQLLTNQQQVINASHYVVHTGTEDVVQGLMTISCAMNRKTQDCVIGVFRTDHELDTQATDITIGWDEPGFSDEKKAALYAAVDSHLNKLAATALSRPQAGPVQNMAAPAPKPGEKA